MFAARLPRTATLESNATSGSLGLDAEIGILIVAIIWTILVLIGSIIATIKAIPPEKDSA